MAPENANSLEEQRPKPPAPQEIEDLKRLVGGIVRAQGNRFIKHLLKKTEGVKIGANKIEFEHNLNEAIEKGNLRLSQVQAWLAEVEGWGDQHVYLYRLTRALQRELTEDKIRQRVADMALDHLWNAPTVLSFPEDPELTSISHSNGILRLIWQESSPDWAHDEDRDYEESIGIDQYKFTAYRKVEKRAITRFEAHPDKRLAALFISDPIHKSNEHQLAIEEAERVLDLLLDLTALKRNRLDIGKISRNLDQRNVPTNAKPNPSIKAQKSRLASGGSYVEFAANSPDKAYWEESAVRDVRDSVRQRPIGKFHGSNGAFIFLPDSNLNVFTRRLRVVLYGNQRRIRLRAQMTATEVWEILTQLLTYA
ncbi:hypothetical protein ACFLSZ_03025 [Candidatus Bipolaricaulota bacterium]